MTGADETGPLPFSLFTGGLEPTEMDEAIDDYRRFKETGLLDACPTLKDVTRRAMRAAHLDELAFDTTWVELVAVQLLLRRHAQLTGLND